MGTWLKTHLFSTPANSAVTVLLLALLAWVVPPAVQWLFIDAVWCLQPVAACDAVRGQGACWAGIGHQLCFMLVGVFLSSVDVPWSA